MISQETAQRIRDAHVAIAQQEVEVSRLEDTLKSRRLGLVVLHEDLKSANEDARKELELASALNDQA